MAEKNLSPLARQLQEEWSLSFIFTRKVDDALKQARAEVLAACAEVAFQDARQKHSGDNFRSKEELEADIKVAIRIAQNIQKLQPAARDLEALLREARLEEAKWWNSNHYPSPQNHDPAKCLCLACSRVAELEKARAEGKG